MKNIDELLEAAAKRNAGENGLADVETILARVREKTSAAKTQPLFAHFALKAFAVCAAAAVVAALAVPVFLYEDEQNADDGFDRLALTGAENADVKPMGRNGFSCVDIRKIYSDSI